MSKKKKPAKKKAENPNEFALRAACQIIVNDLYTQVEQTNGKRLDALAGRLEELRSEFDMAVGECGQIIDRLLAVEKKVVGCQEPQPTTWLGRLHARRWFCLPWCRY